MGLINEVAQVAETMNRREQEKRERENKKLLIYEYSLEITGNLQALFYNLFENNDIQTAYKKAITEKEKNIDKLTAQIENITYTKPHQKTKYYKYKDNFDIVNDLNNKYFIILDKIHREFKRTEKAQNADLLQDLENYIEKAFKLCKNKIKLKMLLQQNYYIDGIIQEITEEKEKQKFLKNNYYKTLQKVSKFYNGYILQQKQEEREQKERERLEAQAAKVRRRDRLLCLHIINKWLK